MTTTNHAAGLNGAVAAALSGMLRESGMRQTDLAERSGIPAVSVQRYLDGKRPINVDLLQRLANALNATPMDVILRAAQIQARMIGSEET